jgi:hypothetical protein
MRFAGIWKAINPLLRFQSSFEKYNGFYRMLACLKASQHRIASLDLILQS